MERGLHCKPREPTAEPASQPSASLLPRGEPPWEAPPPARAAPRTHAASPAAELGARRAPHTLPCPRGEEAGAHHGRAPSRPCHAGRGVHGSPRAEAAPALAALRAGGSGAKTVQSLHASRGIWTQACRIPLQARRFPRGEAAAPPARSAQPGARGSPAGRAPLSGGPGGSLQKTYTQPEKCRRSLR